MGCGMCDVYNRSTNFPVATDQATLIAIECKNLSKQIKPVMSDVRGVSVVLTTELELTFTDTLYF